MGTCNEATFSYGFILESEYAKKLIAVLMKDAVNLSDLFYERSWSMMDAVTEWLESDKELESLSFDVDRSHNARNFELAFTFPALYSGDHSFEFEPARVDFWGREGGLNFIGIPESKIADQRYIDAAKEAFQKVKDSKAFKEAGITDIVPQWILKVSSS